MKYTITRESPACTSTVRRQRRDAATFHAHAAIYDAAEGQGLRDTKAAWIALSAVLNIVNQIKPGGAFSVTLGTDTISIYCS